MLGSRTDLHLRRRFSPTVPAYCNEIVLPYLRLLEALWVCSSFSWTTMHMSSHSSCRTALRVRILNVWIGRHDLRISIIEHVWDFLGRRLAARTLPPVTIRELRLALQDEWAAIPQQLIDTLILSMGRRCETCLAVRGDHISY
ncbi:hypothetical protein TNCV_511491 [Trichonephila clavipes]|nr:hypothetical protein TNCV_511491 [Trichonephila clavipes]